MRLHKGHYEITSVVDFQYWKVLHIEKHKPNVKRLHLVKKGPYLNYFRLAYCHISNLEALIDQYKSDIATIKDAIESEMFKMWDLDK